MQNVKAGAKLVIVENMVLDVRDFMPCHPGGIFKLQKEIGKDITHIINRHSNDAKKAAQSLCVYSLKI
jgi:cytochrome b involved in lipid metabolism